MKIGKITLTKTAALAPMAGVADRAFREICVEQGAAYVVGEMCSAKGLTYQSAKSAQLLQIAPAEGPAAVQLFGEDPETMARAVQLALEYQPQVIDLNMGCPAPKIAGGGSGAALMKNLPLAEKIIAAAVRASTVPVTVKFRSGWDTQQINGVEAAQRAEAAGAAAVTIHGRTKAQMYQLPIDLEIIRAVKQAVRIPVVGNGGITRPQQAAEMYETTGCDLVMIGQGALGRPWIFHQIKAYLEEGILLPEPTVPQRMALLHRQITKAVEYKGEHIALREARTHAGWTMYGLAGAASLRRKAGQIATMEDLEGLIAQVIDHCSSPPKERM